MLSPGRRLSALVREGTRWSHSTARHHNTGAANISESSSSALASSLSTSLLSRRFPVIYQRLDFDAARKLSISLASYLPPSWLPQVPRFSSIDLPPAYHLVYFNPALAADQLLPDGTDPNQSPGEPFVRRMWAGGSVRFRDPGRETGPALRLDSQLYGCVERIRDVSVKGEAGKEKVFVGIERRMGPVDLARRKAGDGEVEAEDAFRARMWREEEAEFGDSAVIERRNIVFMRERSPEEMAAVRALMSQSLGQDAALARKPNQPPTFTHTFTPPASLLFRYSALTFNAHAIHLDPQYCRDTEGHRNLLVHGPLTCTLLMTMLQARVKETLGPNFAIHTFDYRNVAPLYADEPLRLCGRGVDGPEREYRLWAEGSDGRMAVRASATVRETSRYESELK